MDSYGQIVAGSYQERGVRIEAVALRLDITEWEYADPPEPSVDDPRPTLAAIMPRVELLVDLG
jgi:hypothetical protein